MPWSATSDASWLTLTATGITGGSMVLTANPAGLQQDTIHLATVTIESSNPEIGNQESIRVAFWSGSTDPQDLTISGAHRNPVANPVEPWVYVNDGANTIEIYNVYTGALVDTWSTTLFKCNSGCREEEVCSLEWDWEVKVPELQTSVFLRDGLAVLPDYTLLDIGARYRMKLGGRPAALRFWVGQRYRRILLGCLRQQ